MNRDGIKKALLDLRNDFFIELENRPENFSEEYVRSVFLNRTLELFGWNLSNTNEVIQEKKITDQTARKNLLEIDSSHIKPDYQLLDRGILKLYLDAKNVYPSFLDDQSTAFQIRSYGWSSRLNFSMVSDFQHFRVYDTSFKPSYDIPSDFKTITFSIDDLINEFDIYSQFIDRNKIKSGNWELDKFSLEIEEGYKKTFDSDFISLINDLQINLAKGILVHNKKITETDLRYFVQVIINRLLFNRVLESIDYEPYGRLLNWLKNGKGFWKQFNETCINEYYYKYDGAMYDFRIPRTIQIDDEYFQKFIQNLYGYTPYRFDVIEPEFIAEMYDYFLGKEIYTQNDEVLVRNKKTSPTGSIPTPPDLAGYIVGNVLDLEKVETEKTLLSFKILDPCVGSGIFLVKALDKLIIKLQEITNTDVLPYDSIKNIVVNCLYGVDLDPIAIEVLKMTLSLKLVMVQHVKPEPLENILGDFSGNFQLGNSIVETDILDKHKLPDVEKNEQIPTDYKERFPDIMESGGFTHIVANPPYIEPKHFKGNWPITYGYLRERYLIKKGKVDISMFFLERVFELLRENGKIGLVIQKRFFTTSYGKKMREWLASNGYLSEIKEYMSNDLFKFKTTYVATLFGGKKEKLSINYSASTKDVKKDRSNLKTVIEGNDFNTKLTKLALKNASTWSYRYFKNSKIVSTLLDSKKFFTINGSNRLRITVGPQALDKQYYFIRECNVFNGIINGVIYYTDPKTRKKETKKITIEETLAKKIYENDNLNSFEDLDKNKIDTYLIFPYDSNAKLIPLDELKTNFPLTYEYLKWMDVMSTNQRRANPDEFYGYTRNQNLLLIDKAKIFVPMTAKRVTASFSEKGVYGDNSNINAIVDLKENNRNILKALTVVLNSEIFSLLTIVVSGEARGGHYKMNKQFLGEVPIPALSDKDVNYLSLLYNNILMEIGNYKNAYGDRKKIVLNELKILQNKQNLYINNIYALSEDEMAFLKQDVDIGTLDWLAEMDWND